MRATVTTPPELRVGAPRAIVNDPLLTAGGGSTKQWDVAPEGRVLAIRNEDGVRSDRLVVVRPA